MISDVVSPKHMFSSVKVKSVSKNLVTIRVLPKSLPDVKPKVEGGQGCIEFPAVFFYQRDLIWQRIQPRQYSRNGRTRQERNTFESAVF